jgi:hypothetical protein
MKLTNYIRDAFINSVMNDVPEKDFHEEGKKIFVKHYLDLLPKEVQMAWVLPNCKAYIQTRYASVCGQSFVVPHDGSNGHRNVDVPLKAKDKIDALTAQYKTQQDNRAALRSKVKGAAYACTTTKQLRELLPEFDRYLPAEEEKTLRTLPVVQNIVADFVKAGWPAGAKKGGAK